MARWLVDTSTWGVLATVDSSGAPSGGAVSHGAAAGRIFFYLTPMDETAGELQARPACAYVVSEAQSPDRHTGLCHGMDAEDPACAKASVRGTVSAVARGSDDEALARGTLFTRHPSMAGWPADHNFSFYELRVSSVHLLDWYGGMRIVPASEYYAATLDLGTQPQPQAPADGR